MEGVWLLYVKADAAKLLDNQAGTRKETELVSKIQEQDLLLARNLARATRIITMQNEKK